MRKRSKYRPRAVLANPVAYVVESITPVTQHDSYLVDLKIKNHGAMAALTRGHATRADMDTLIAMSNMIEALWTLGFGKEYEAVMCEGQAALISVGRRGLADGRFILRASEMASLNELMELHDAQMEVVTVGDIERGIEIIRKRERTGRVHRITA
jgi:hypothetical protein